MIASCTSSTAPKTSTVRGRVILEGMDDHQAVSVLLYKAGIVGDELRAVNTQYPSLGFPLWDQHLFDHRDYAPVYSTTTSTDGSFEINKVERDKYILVLLHEGFGPRYLYDLELDSDALEANNGEDITLFEVIELPQYVDGDFVFESGKSYVAETDVTFLPGSVLSVMGGSALWIGSQSSVTCHGEIEFQSSHTNPFKIGSKDQLYHTDTSFNPFAKFEISQLAELNEITGLVFRNSQEGLVLKGSNIDVSECLFSDNATSFLLTLGGDITVRNSYFVKSVGSNGVGLSLFDSHDVVIEYSSFSSISSVSLLIEISQGIKSKNNLFNGGRQHILNRFSSQLEVDNCTFLDGVYCLTNTASSTMEVQWSDIYGETCIYTYHTANHINTPSNGWTKASFNNFNSSKTAVEARGYFVSNDDYVVLNFADNFWGTSNTQEIADMIIDYYDLEPPEYPQRAWPLIEYVPFRPSRVVNAGVQ
ncbi:MAG: right-handed parallel beta-helix repeat-containing protein [Fermentimonas sp.]|nr:right-handed parallel beta-helix repeat-containing protein [Fermentimonas sp.]